MEKIEKYAKKGAEVGLPPPNLDDNLMAYRKAIRKEKIKNKIEKQKAKLKEKLAKLE